MSQVPAEVKNFDEVFATGREFIVGGQLFHWVQMHWREWGEFLDNQVKEQEAEAKEREEKLERLKAEAKARGEDPESIVPEDRSTVIDSFEYVVKRIKNYVEPSEHTRFDEVIEDRSKHISIEQLQLLLVWLQEVQTPERPTSGQEPSESGPTETAPISQVA